MSKIQQVFVVAVDIGTTSTKALVIHRNGAIKSTVSKEYSLNTSKPERAEQDAAEIFLAVKAAVFEAMRESGADPAEVICVSFSSAMHSLMAVDEHSRPLTPCITWADNRSADYVGKLKENGWGHRLYARTGTPIHPMSPLLKLMWMRDNEPDIFQNVYKWIGIKEYVFAKLFGKYVVDYSIASATGLFNIEHLDWNEESLLTACIDRSKLSELVPTTEQFRGLQAETAAEMGLDENTHFVIGASDGVLANLGAGAIDPGVYSVTIGTSGAVRGILNHPVVDPRGRLFCYSLTEHHWIIGGAINNGGIMLRWVRDTLATLEAEHAADQGLEPYDYLISLAEQSSPGSDGLLFLPLLTGERSPHWNANARGVFFGLSMQHEKKHMIRAVMEGVMFRIQSVLEALEEVSGETREIRASGGFARSELWLQMLADISGKTVSVSESVESSAIGAAQLGLLSVGEVSDLQHFNGWVTQKRYYQPNKNLQDMYRQLFQIYKAVYAQLSVQFDAISAFQKAWSQG